MNCDAGGACCAGHTCHPVKCTLPTVVITRHPRGDILHGDARAVSACAAEQQASVHSVLRVRQRSGASRWRAQNAPPAGTDLCHECLRRRQHGFNTTGLVSGSTTFTSACTASGVFASPASCRVVSCGFHVDVDMGTDLGYRRHSCLCHRSEIYWRADLAMRNQSCTAGSHVLEEARCANEALLGQQPSPVL